MPTLKINRRHRSRVRVQHSVFGYEVQVYGQTVYRFSYVGDPRTQIGLIAQEVERRVPGAVIELGGLKHVDYRRATEQAVQQLKAA